MLSNMVVPQRAYIYTIQYRKVGTRNYVLYSVLRLQQDNWMMRTLYSAACAAIGFSFFVARFLLVRIVSPEYIIFVVITWYGRDGAIIYYDG